MAQVIKRTNTNPWGQAFGIMGQGVSGFTDGVMAKKMLDMWGKQGEKINPPVTGTAAATPATATQPAQAQPTAGAQPTNILPSTPANAGGTGAGYAGISADQLQELLNKTLGWIQGV